MFTLNLLKASCAIFYRATQYSKICQAAKMKNKNIPLVARRSLKTISKACNCSSISSLVFVIDDKKNVDEISLTM